MTGGPLVKAASKSHFCGMRHLLLIFVHLVGSLGKLLRPDGAKAVVAENCLLKHQLLIARRSRRRAPNLRFCDRLLFGLGSLFLRPRRLLRTAILIKPSTLLRCHRALVQLKLKWLYSSGHRHTVYDPAKVDKVAIAAAKDANIYVTRFRVCGLFIMRALEAFIFSFRFDPGDTTNRGGEAGQKIICLGRTACWQCFGAHTADWRHRGTPIGIRG